MTTVGRSTFFIRYPPFRLSPHERKRPIRPNPGAGVNSGVSGDNPAMRHTLAVVVLCLASAGAALATSAPPRLAIAMRTPTLVVRGTGFHARERVTLTAGTVIEHVRATRLGSFTVNTGVTLSRCDGIFVHAVGTAGSNVFFKLPQPAC